MRGIVRSLQEVVMLTSVATVFELVNHMVHQRLVEVQVIVVLYVIRLEVLSRVWAACVVP